ncbi:MAG: dipicolinate synthase [Ruminococcaceae bacterium]|nr:dipicolinate synthase [Oscillospiraceae bacterium]
MVFAIIGGDERQIYLKQKLRRDGHTVRMCGFERHSSHISCLKVGDALFGADCVILPLPSSKDGKTVWTPLGTEEILLCDLPKAAGKKTLFLTALTHIGAARECDYFAKEELTVLNAALTAEGAVASAINNTSRALLGANCLVAGFGRIGKLLCSRLLPFGAKVYATSRRPETMAWIRSYGFEGIDIGEVERNADKFDIIFNTAPQPLFTRNILTRLKSDCVFIELASPPFGIDFEAAEELGIKVIKASGLPAKTAPEAAAEIIYDTVKNIINQKI